MTRDTPGRAAVGLAPGAMEEVPRVPFASLTRETFAGRFRRPGRPVVVEGVLDGLPDWTLEYIEARLDDTPRLVRRYGAERFTRPRREWANYAAFEPLPISAYAKMLADRTAHRERIYMAQVDIGGTPLGAVIRSRIDALGARCEMERFVPCDLNLWLGPSGHTEPLHFDPADGTLIQTHGSKRVVLFPPWETDGLYPFPVLNGPLPPWFSQVDIRAPDFETFPALRGALPRRLEVTIHAGDVLYIPAFWWHEVTALGDDFVCSINRFWRINPVRRNFTVGPSRQMRVRSALMFAHNHLPMPVLIAINRVLAKLGVRSFG